jgi:hypothetical protein
VRTLEVKNLIQSAANVIKIVNLKVGDVFKMIETGYSENEMYYGVVLDLLNSGKESFIQILRYKKSYGDITAEFKTYSGSKDISLFPATIEEVQQYLKEAVEHARRKVSEKKDELQKLIEATSKAEEFVSGELSKTLTLMAFKEQSQEAYNVERKAIEEKKKELES